MNRFSMGNRLQIVMLGIVVAGAVAAFFPFAPARAAGDIADEAKVLVKLDEEWSAAAGRRDVEKVASFYTEDAVAYPPNEPVCVGRDAAKKVWAAYLSEPSFNISWKSTHAEIARSGELGFTSGTFEDSFKGPDGKMVHETGKFLCVWKKQADGSWKAIHDMWNTDAK